MFLELMVFTVSPRVHVRCPSGEGLENKSASLIDSDVYSEDYSMFYYFRGMMTVDPFVSSVIDSIGDGSDGDLGVESCLQLSDGFGWARVGCIFSGFSAAGWR